VAVKKRGTGISEELVGAEGGGPGVVATGGEAVEDAFEEAGEGVPDSPSTGERDVTVFQPDVVASDVVKLDVVESDVVESDVVESDVVGSDVAGACPTGLDRGRSRDEARRRTRFRPDGIAVDATHVYWANGF
jgi:hypothetical protein